MFDEILGKLKESIPADMLDKLGLDEKEKEDALKEVAESVKYRVKKEANRGNIEKMTSLFSENDNTEEDNVMASKMQGDMMWGFMNKLGFDKDKAGGLASSLLPGLLKSITGGLSEKKSNDTNGILSMFGDGDNILDTIKSKLGGLGSLFGK